jgi:hypothetical protein
MENIPLYLIDMIGMNLVMTVIFVQANLMYFSTKNLCWYTNDTLTKVFYLIFCGFTLLGYLQFIWCILLSCSIPLSAFLIYQLVEHRMSANREDGAFNDGLIGGLMQVPLPIPEILSSLSRTKFQAS